MANSEIVGTSVKRLIIHRDQIRDQITRLLNYVKSEDCTDTEQIKPRHEKVEEAWNDFCRVQGLIVHAEPLVTDHRVYANDFETLYFDTVAAYAAKLHALANESGAVDPTTVPEAGPPRRPAAMVNLAALSLSKFSGNYEEWTTFQNVYIAWIHSNKNLTDVQKFAYLKSALTGDAYNMIKTLECTAENYEIAWNTLVERYNNKRYLVENHTKSIYNLKPVQRESSAELWRLTEAVVGHINALDTLGQNPKRWGSLFVHVVSTKLDIVTLKEWEVAKSNLDDVPEIDELLKFLENRIRILESVESLESMKLINNNNSSHNRSTIKEKAKKFWDDCFYKLN